MFQLAFFSLMTVGCGKKPGAYQTTQEASSDALAKADAMWSERGDPAKLDQTLELYEQAHQADPDNKHILGRLVRGWYFMGDAHKSDKKAKMAAWDKAVAFGDICLSQNENYKSTLEQSNNKGEAIKSIENKDFVPCIYWYASSLGKWAKSNGILQSLKHKPTFVGFMQQVESLQPDYFYGAPHRYWGAYYAVLPSFAGRDLDKSKVEFDKSLAIAPEYLGTYLLLADNWARNTQNVEEFDQAVQYVLASDVSVLPEALLPENRAELKKAAKLWEERSSIFVNPPEAQPLKKQPPQAAPEAPEEPAPEAPAPEAPAPEESEKAPEAPAPEVAPE